MIILPFGQTVWLWRRQAGLTQQALAKRARLPQSNLSAIERGRRAVSLTTIRALAAALGVRPGVLVDGLPPGSPVGGQRLLSRKTIERIADAVAGRRLAAEPSEQVVVDALRALLKNRMCAARRQYGQPRIGARRVLAAWIRLKSFYGSSAIETLAERALERLPHDTTND